MDTNLPTRILLQNPDDESVQYELEAKGDGVYINKLQTTKSTETLEPGVTQTTIIITRTLGDSVTF